MLNHEGIRNERARGDGDFRAESSLDRRFPSCGDKCRSPISAYRSSPSKVIRFHPKSSEIEGRDSINAGAEIDLEDFHGPFDRAETRGQRNGERVSLFGSTSMCNGALDHTQMTNQGANCFPTELLRRCYRVHYKYTTVPSQWSFFGRFFPWTAFYSASYILAS